MTSAPSMLPLLPLAVLLLGAVVAPLLERIEALGPVTVAELWAATGVRPQPVSVAAVSTGLALLLVLSALPAVAGGHVLTIALPWVPAMGLELALRLDGLSLIFALLILGIGLLVGLYARYYLPADAPRGRFHGLMLAFQASMLGLVLADNLLLLVLCWELTGLLSFLLIAFDPGARGARRGAGVALLVTAAGGLALLAGVLLLDGAAGSARIGDVLAAAETIRADPLHGVIMVLILLGVFTKSAQVPFHAWLPAAMAAPTPVSAYLHSATLVKAGVFLLARLWPVFAGSPGWFPLVSGVGLASFVFAAYVALFKDDLKGLLAYSTISHLGLIVFLFGLGTPLGAVAGLFHALNHAVFKASLFMATGIIDHETGTRDIRQLRGLYACLPVTGTLALVAAAAMAGVPLLNGFLSKEMFFTETLDPHVAAGWPWAPRALLDLLLPLAAVLGGLFSVAYSLRFGLDVFFNGPPPAGRCPPHEPSIWMRLPIVALVALCVLVGVFPQETVAPLLAIGSQGILGAVPTFHLAPWQGLTPALVMSALALFLGLLVYLGRRQVFRLHDRFFPPHRADQVYRRAGDHLVALARAAQRVFGPPSLPASAAWLFATATVVALLGWGVAGWVPFGAGAAVSWRSSLPLDAPSLAGALILAVGVLAMARHPGRRLRAVLFSGAIGLVVSLSFVHFSAPDLALTQLAVEVVTTLLLLAALALLPATGRARASPAGGGVPGRWLRGAIAVAAGLVSTALAAVVLLRPRGSIGDWYLGHAESAAHAQNVVNALLMDFRGLDTLGETTVLALAGISVALLLPAGGPVPAGDGPDPAGEDGPSLLLRVLSALVLPVALMLAAFLLLRGHQAPGGGFVAGLVVATALVLDQLAWGRPTLPRWLRPQALIGLGLGVAWLTALWPLHSGKPLLMRLHWHPRLPLVGEIAVGSTLIFDIGVLLVVAGALLVVFDRLASQPAAAAIGDEDPARGGRPEG